MVAKKMSVTTGTRLVAFCPAAGCGNKSKTLPKGRSIVDPWSCSSAMGHWLRSPRRATRRRGATAAWSSSPASRGSARPRSSRGSCGDLDAGARVLFGTCDDLSIPRPLGPIRDLVGSVSAPLEEALSAGAAAARDPDAC